ncbi:Uncharacterised protein [Vibrio cholerae]|nr:Uncharacterised protein [Vibrio cholerae]
MSRSCHKWKHCSVKGSSFQWITSRPIFLVVILHRIGD